MSYSQVKNFRGNIHTSIATLNPNYHNAQLVVAIGTYKGSHLFHSGINTNLLQRMFQMTQPAFFVAIRSRYRNPLICWLLQD
jgi:pantothenate kinase